MSVLTLPGGSTPETVVRYRAALLDQLDHRDPTDVLRAMPAWCIRIVADTPAETLATPEQPGKWSARDVIHHLADSEVMWCVRLRRVLAEERPRLDGYDQDLWAARLRYAERPVAPSLTLFAAARTANLDLLDRASITEYDRAGVHGERGDETVRDMTRLYAGHDVAHQRQIERILAGVA